MMTPFYGWVVVGCAFLVLFLTYGVQYSFGVFVLAMVDEFGWQRASLGGAFSLYSVVYMGFSILSGRLTDSLGPRRVIALGGVLLGLGLMATSQISAQWQLYLTYGIVAALGMSTAYVPCNMTVVRWFHRKRGLALGIASCGASCGILFVPVLASFIIVQADWRVGLLSLGTGLFVLINVIARFMVRSPEQRGLLPDGADALTGARQTVPTPNEAVGWTLREARATLSLWMFLLAFAVALLTITVPFVHLPFFARDIGLSAMAGAMAVSVTGLFALVGSIGLGALSDRVGCKPAMVLALSVQVAAFLIFVAAKNSTFLYVGAAAFGFFYGGIATLFPALVGDLFGRAHAGAVGGFIFGGAGILGAWGPAVAGYFRDIDGDYRFAFTLCALTAGCALLLFLLLPRPRHRFLLSLKKDYSAAVRLIETALKLSPSSAVIYANYSIISRFMGDYDRSVAMIHKAMRLDPHHPVWYFSTLGINLALAGQYEEVVEHWRENRLKISPKNNVPEVNLIIAYRGLGDLENARRIATELSRINPNYTLESFRNFLPLKDKMRLDEMSSWLKEAGIPENTPRAQTK